MDQQAAASQVKHPKRARCRCKGQPQAADVRSFLLPGEGVPQGRMRGVICSLLHANFPHPAVRSFLLPAGEGVPQGRMRGVIMLTSARESPHPAVPATFSRWEKESRREDEGRDMLTSARESPSSGRAFIPSPRGRRCPAGTDEGLDILTSAREIPSSGRSGHLLPGGEGMHETLVYYY